MLSQELLQQLIGLLQRQLIQRVISLSQLLKSPFIGHGLCQSGAPKSGALALLMLQHGQGLLGLFELGHTHAFAHQMLHYGVGVCGQRLGPLRRRGEVEPSQIISCRVPRQ